jgi:hypothetical protein
MKIAILILYNLYYISRVNLPYLASFNSEDACILRTSFLYRGDTQDIELWWA